jgi:hypothetical protein
MKVDGNKDVSIVVDDGSKAADLENWLSKDRCVSVTLANLLLHGFYNDRPLLIPLTFDFI